MNKKIKLSIIIPAYNTEKYVSECLKSIVNQGAKDYEIIVIDDGSADNTLKICDEYAKKYKQLRVVHVKNSGVSAARNLGIQKARGELIWFIDSDDCAKPNSITTILNEHKSDLLVFGFEEFDKINKAEHIYGSLIADKDYVINQALSDTGIRGYLFNKVFKLDTIKKHRLYFEESISNCEDLLFTVQYMSFAKKTQILNKVLYQYRRRRGGAIHDKINLSQSTAIEAFLSLSKKDIRDDAKAKARALFVKAYYKYLPILSKERKKKYEKDLRKYRQFKKTFSIKDRLLIFGYRFLNPIMRLLHTPTARGKSLYD